MVKLFLIINNKYYTILAAYNKIYYSRWCEMDNNSENILWLVSVMKQYMDEDYAVETSYNWLRYNSKDDFELIYRTSDPENTEVIFEIGTDRKGNIVKSTSNALLEDNTLVEAGEPLISEMYKDTNILLKEKSVSNNGSEHEKQIILQKEEVKDNITYLEVLYENEKVLAKYTIYPDNKIKEEKYANNIKIEESEQKEYYFNNCLVTYLTKNIYFINDETKMETEMYVESEEMIDENTAVITIVQEDKTYGNDAVTEYILKKYIKENGKIIPYEQHK